VEWWVEPEHRGAGVRLVREAEKRAKEAGAQRIQMIAPTKQVGAIYERLGYAFIESAYGKRL
jgi:histone acetyltransferase (RNA polymerase elongator complex component)